MNTTSVCDLTMFNISVDESGKTYDASELVKDKSEAAIGNARKRKYFCVTCVDEKHPVYLKTRRKIDHIDKKTRNYTALAWFSHHGAGNGGKSKKCRNESCSETAIHWQAKHILCENVGGYWFETSKCSGCAEHTNIENGNEALGQVEYNEKTSDGKTYRFDTVLLRNKVVTSVIEVWATHETSEQKREYCLKMGYTFAEFHAPHVLEAHAKATPGLPFMLENLKIRVFECKQCAQARQKLEQERLLAIQIEQLKVIEAAEESRLKVLEVEKQKKLQAQELENKRVLLIEARDNEIKLREIEIQEKQKKIELECKRLELENKRQEEIYTEYYNETSAGKETQILQLQDTLHCNYLYKIWIATNSTFCEDFHPDELCCDQENSFIESYGPFPGNKASRLVTIHDTKAWFGIYREKAIKSAQSRIYIRESSGTRGEYIKYEKGVSFKCICGKWAHPTISYPRCMKIYRNTMRHTTFDNLVRTNKLWIKARAPYVDPSDRTCDFEEESDPYFMACGMCVTSCIFCKNSFLLDIAASNGCCGSCTHKTIDDINTKKMSVSAHIDTTIKYMETKIVKACL